MIRSSAGQSMLEMILLMAVVVAVFSGVSKILRERGVFQKTFGEPWVRISNTIEYGVPSNDKREASKNLPGSDTRVATRINR